MGYVVDLETIFILDSGYQANPTFIPAKPVSVNLEQNIAGM